MGFDQKLWWWKTLFASNLFLCVFLVLTKTDRSNRSLDFFFQSNKFMCEYAIFLFSSLGSCLCAMYPTMTWMKDMFTFRIWWEMTREKIENQPQTHTHTHNGRLNVVLKRLSRPFSRITRPLSLSRSSFLERLGKKANSKKTSNKYVLNHVVLWMLRRILLCFILSILSLSLSSMRYLCVCVYCTSLHCVLTYIHL